MLGHSGPVWTVHANRVHFIQEGNGTVLLGKIADLLNGCNRSTHAVHRFKGNNLGLVRRQRSQLSLQIFHVVMFEDHLLGAGVTNALDH